MKRNQHEGADDSPAARFYIEALPVGDEPFQWRGEEALHAFGSRRLRAGEFITLFDGSGWDLSAAIESASRSHAVLRPLSRSFVGAPLAVPVVCASALPKGSREDLLVSKCAELGVARLVPVEFERSVVRAGVHWDRRKARWRRLAIEAAKQSGASTLMEVAEPIDFELLVGGGFDGLRLVGVPGADKGIAGVLAGSGPLVGLQYLVGPEGGMTEAEAVLAVAAGFEPVRIASTTLRIETACIAFASVAAAFVTGRGPKSVAK